MHNAREAVILIRSTRGSGGDENVGRLRVAFFAVGGFCGWGFL